MRTTLTIEPAVAERLRKLLIETPTGIKTGRGSAGPTFKGIVNEALRQGLRVMETSAKQRSRFVVEPHNFGGLNPGIDPTKLGQSADDLENEAILAGLQRSGAPPKQSQS